MTTSLPTLAAWVHDLSPFVFRLWDNVGLRWYGLSYVLGFIAAWAVMRELSKRRLTPLGQQRITDAMLTLMIGVVVGGRLGYCLFYRRELLTDFSSDFPWWGLLRITDGGMASHGGMIGVIVAAWFVARGGRSGGMEAEPPVSYRHVLDLLAFSCTPGLFFGRIANFINGELLGRIVAMPGEPAPWWSVKFPQEVFSGHGPPGQEQAIGTILGEYRLPGESLEAAYERLLTTIQSGGDAGRRAVSLIEPLLSARHPSQLYQAVAEGIVLGAFLLWVWRRPRLPGVVGCWFLIGYGVLRVLTEFVRLPDAHLVVQRILGLSRGQWLSMLMIAAGFGLMAWISQHGGTPMGGWARTRRGEE
jgi:phosphatidylglycerol:prolipoprotein diacylglycerol transferase